MLQWASKHNNIRIIKQLLKNNIDHVETEYSIINAITENNVKVLKLLLKDERFDPAFNNNYPIRLATKLNLKKCTYELLKNNKVDPSFNNETLSHAIKNNNPVILKLLLKDKRINPSVDNNSALHYAEKHGYKKIQHILKQDYRFILT